MTYNPQASTAQLNAAGYADTPTGRAQFAAGSPPSGLGAANQGQIGNGLGGASGGTGVPTAMTNDQLTQGLQQLLQAFSSGNTSQFQEALREFNLTYTNSVAEQYGQNFGVGQPAQPPGVPTLAAGQATGSIGYIPGFTGTDASQTGVQILRSRQRPPKGPPV